MTAPARASDAVSELLTDIHLAPRQSSKQLTIWPLRLGRGVPDGQAPYISLADALALGHVRVEETGGGSVPHVALANTGSLPVLVLFGEEILGAKQNRIANASFLVGARRRVVLDVSCVEQGRWSSGARGGFTASEHVVSSRMRARIAHDVGVARRRGAGFLSDQGTVWRDVGERIGLSGVASPSQAYAAYARSHAADHEHLATALPVVVGQVGFVASIDGEIAGAEIVGDPRIYARVHDRLLRSYTIDLRAGASPRASEAAFDSPEAFLDALGEAPRTSGRSLGLGADIRFATPRLSGCGLVWKEPVHLSAFAAPQRPGRRPPGKPPGRGGLLRRLRRRRP